MTQPKAKTKSYHEPDSRRRSQKKLSKKPAGWKRRCQRCGCDPWPNYLLCEYCRELALLSDQGTVEPYDIIKDYRGYHNELRRLD